MTLVRTLFHAGFHHVVIASHKTSLFFVQIQKTKNTPEKPSFPGVFSFGL